MQTPRPSAKVAKPAAAEPTPKEARQQAKLTQLEVATLAGITPSTVFRIEATNRWPRRVTTLRKLRKALGLSP